MPACWSVLFRELEEDYADYQSARTPGTQEDRHQDEESRAPGQPAEARRLRARVHADPEEAELSAPQGGARSSDQRHRGDDLYSRRRPQPAGTLARPDP